MSAHRVEFRAEPVELPCTSWCEVKDVDDESCYSHEHYVRYSRPDRVHVVDDKWQDAFIVTYAQRSRLDDSLSVHLGVGDRSGLRLTLDEARALASALSTVVDEVERG